MPPVVAITDAQFQQRLRAARALFVRLFGAALEGTVTPPLDAGGAAGAAAMTAAAAAAAAAGGRGSGAVVAATALLGRPRR